MPEGGEGTGSGWLCHCELTGRICKGVNDRRRCPLSIFASNYQYWKHSHTAQQLPSSAAGAGHAARYLLSRRTWLDPSFERVAFFIASTRRHSHIAEVRSQLPLRTEPLLLLANVLLQSFMKQMPLWFDNIMYLLRLLTANMCSACLSMRDIFNISVDSLTNQHKLLNISHSRTFLLGRILVPHLSPPHTKDRSLAKPKKWFSVKKWDRTVVFPGLLRNNFFYWIKLCRDDVRILYVLH